MSIWGGVVTILGILFLLAIFAERIAYNIGRAARLICPPKTHEPGDTKETRMTPEVAQARQEYLNAKRERRALKRRQRRNPR